MCMKLAVFEGENVWTKTNGFSSMLSLVLGTKLKQEGAIRNIAIVFSSEKSPCIAHKGKSWRQTLQIFSQCVTQTGFWHWMHMSLDCFAFFAPLLTVKTEQRFLGRSRGLWVSGRLGKTGTCFFSNICSAISSYHSLWLVTASNCFTVSHFLLLLISLENSDFYDRTLEICLITIQ